MHAPQLIMLALVWNCRGLGRPEAIRSLRVFVKTHKPSLLFVSELHTASSQKIQRICSSLGYGNVEFVPAIRRVGGLLLC